YHQPWDIFGRADEVIFGTPSPFSEPQEVALAMLPYIEAHLSSGGRLHQVTRHMLGLFAGRPGARAWRRALSEGATRQGAGPELVEDALAQLGSSDQMQRSLRVG
ncbi:MAG: tRNA-dihydrouridine synthase, partial [Pseudomonadota bacterium]